ncbi:MAG: hypothetical protein V3V62_05670 [bacterium]
MAVIVETPTRLSERQRRLLEELQRLSNPSTHPIGRRRFEKIKGFSDLGPGGKGG